MSLFSDNIRFLREKKNVSQDELAKVLSVTRSSYAKYELGLVEAPHRVLLATSRYYNVSLDLLLSVDIRKVDVEKLLNLEDNRILLPIAVDRHGDNIIEIIPYKAKAGYLTGYSDPEFIEHLDQMQLPFLKQGKYRAFPIEGDSMPPHREGSFVIGEYVENKADIKAGSTYVLLTKNEGIVYKRVHALNKSIVFLSSDNKAYKTYNVKFSEILEVWRFACSLSTIEFDADDWSTQTLKEIITELRREIIDVKKKLK
jgi:transcriptional regulator with XRE-family HTH domain